MKKKFSTKRSAIALLLVLVLAVCVPVKIFFPENDLTDKFPVTQDNNSILMNTDTINDYKTAQSIPAGEELPELDNILDYLNEVPADENINNIELSPVAKEGTTIVPATLNNVMLDNLPSIIAKKVYTFSIDTRGALKYVFNHTKITEKNCLWHITLYEEYSPDGTGKNVEYRVLNRTSYESIGKGVQSSSIGVYPGNYRVEVECVSGYTDAKYQLAIGFAETSFYEAEPNNTASRYTELPLNRTINGSASVLPNGKSDTDYYLFRITETGYTVLYFEHENDSANSKDNVAWRITLTDEKGNEYFYSPSTMGKSMINSGIMGLPPGYYFVTVNSHMYSNVEYKLNVSFTKDSAIEKELNDTPKTANPIKINTEKVGSLTSRDKASDRDYFSFTMEQDGFVVIDFIHEAMTEEKDGWNVSILSADDKLIYSSVSKWNQAVLQSPNVGLPKGNYYIRIDSDNLYHNSMVYKLVLMTVQNSDWETEPNNTPTDADILKLGTSINGTMIETGVDYDRDWYKITTTKTSEIKVTFNHIKTEESGKEGWIISLVDNGGNVIESVSSDWNEEEITFSSDLVAGSYYVLVETGLHFNSNRYVLTVK